MAACGGGGGAGQVHPANTASAAVENFMQAVADSNLVAMASLWGTAKGSAAHTKQPPDYERRIVVMRSYLVNDDCRIESDAPDGSDGRHAVQVQIRRQACTWTVPFGVIQMSRRHLARQSDRSRPRPAIRRGPAAHRNRTRRRLPAQ